MEESTKASVPCLARAMWKGMEGARQSLAKQDIPRQSTGCAGAGGGDTPGCPPTLGAPMSCRHINQRGSQTAGRMCHLVT